MLSFLAAKSPQRTRVAHQNPFPLEDGRSKCEFTSKDSKYSVKQWCPAGSRIMNPLLHIHHSQTENFYVREGTGVWTMPYHDDPTKRRFTVSASAKSEEDRKVFIPLGEYHRFENLDPNQVLVIEASYDRPEYESEEMFFRNFLTYLSDCEKARMAPSVYQLNAFLHQFRCPPALPVPGPKWVKYWYSCFMCWFQGVVVGQWILGYETTYPEYYEPTLRSSKSS
ncbi:hypothetical protein EV356DRAFT_508329 [Viridothelium virens]|uniref:Cupin type-1 domain-containing protein n=1 Tax=Viridothelium virens TaxID=1048519 RepID=A0A6A6GYL0_VIRVR|nr:hypothetical protein EV356DRAFT_508329 [Viridothelium virens]